MRNNSEEETISFLHYKEIVMTMFMLVPLILYQSNLLSSFSLFLGVKFIFDIFWNSGENSVQTATTRKKQTRSPGKNISSHFAKKKHSLNLNGGSYREIRGYTIDRLFVSTEEIAKERNGIVVLKGAFEGREVAVKRLLIARSNVACKQVEHLVKSDQHPNIVRFHGVKYDKDHFYVVLERCICSLSDLVENPQQSLDEFGNKANLWKNNGYPSALLLKLMRDMVHGLVHLHELGIIHEDINPKNVMIAKGIDICAKLSEIGISKYLISDLEDSSSLRWSSPKQKHHKYQRWAADMHSLGCVFYFCLSRGGHPSDHHLEDETNNGIKLHLVNHIPEAVDLLSSLLKPKTRQKAKQVLHHPLFWDSEMRLFFLRDVSDRLERENKKRRSSKILIAMENLAQQVFGARWKKKMDSELVKDMKRRRPYNYRSVQHLLRVVRNMLNHYHDSPKNIQELLGPVPEGLDDYFRCRFPTLLMEVYKVVIRHCRLEKAFGKYFGVDYITAV